MYSSHYVEDEDVIPGY